MNRNHVEIVASTSFDPTKAAALLIFTKQTRLEMDGTELDSVYQTCCDDPQWMEDQLDYMSKTIRSSWEFLDVTFSIRNVSRACAQQITRTRFTPIDGDLFGSYAMQSQRVTDMSKAGWHNPHYRRGETTEESLELESAFDAYAQGAINAYQDMISRGAKLEDARGLLPVNLHCNLIAKYNLRMLVDLVQARSSYRAQGEFNTVAAEMRSALIEMWPWAELFLRPKNELAAAAYQDVTEQVRRIQEENLISDVQLHHLRIALAKLNDIVQGGK